MTKVQERTDLPGETWLPIPGRPGYEVSDLGRVYSVQRPFTPRSGRFLKQALHTSGHLYLELSRDGVGKRFYVHQLVALAFHGPRPDGMEVRHLDGNPANNVPSNLKWGTRSENLRDKVHHGTDHQTRKTHCPQEHEYTPENTARGSHGERRCRQCFRDRDRRRVRNRDWAAEYTRRKAAA